MGEDGEDERNGEALRALGLAVRVQRVKREMTQEQLALESGLHRSHVSKIETGQLNPSYASLLRLAEALGTPLHHLIRAAGEFDAE